MIDLNTLPKRHTGLLDEETELYNEHVVVFKRRNLRQRRLLGIDPPLDSDTLWTNRDVIHDFYSAYADTVRDTFIKQLMNIEAIK